MDRLTPHEYDPALGKFMYAPNTYARARQEGWAITFVGKHNTFAIRDIDKNPLPKIAIWGDSAVEGLQVPDEHKMAQQVTAISAQTGQSTIGVGIAHSANNLVDYIVDLREYELLIPNIVSHYIVFSNVEDDTLPDRNTGTERSRFWYKDGFVLFESDNKRLHQEIHDLLGRLNLRMVSYVIGKVSRYRVQFPWKHREATANMNREAEGPPYNKLEAWEFIFGELRKQSTKPITLVYTPALPHIRRGAIQLKESYERERDLTTIAEICRRHNIDFIDLTQNFNDFFLKTMKFPRGFANTFPGRGHFNADGHRIVAEAIFSHEVSNNLVSR
jgi:lysophospholipase L1-like esterase